MAKQMQTKLIKPRSRRFIKTPKPFLKPKCRTYFAKVTDIDGQRRQINLGTADKKEARIRAKKEADFINSQLDGTFAKVMPLVEMIGVYFESKVNLAASSIKRNKEHAHFFVCFMRTHYPQIKYFNQVNQVHIAEFQIYRLENIVRGKKVSAKTVKESMYVINNLFEWAIKRNYVHANPVRKVELVKSSTKDQHVFSQNEIIQILNHCKVTNGRQYLYAPYLTLATTGLRSGELSNLVWNDIDFSRRVIKIRTKVLPDGRKWTTKTRQGRELKMDDELFNVLFEISVQSNSEWVFCNTKGNRLTEYMLWSNLRVLCDFLEIKRGQVHSFRRTFACMMDRAVNDRVAIQQTLGHATMTMTDRYCGYRPKEYIDKAHLKTTSEFIQKLKAAKQ